MRKRLRVNPARAQSQKKISMIDEAEAQQEAIAELEYEIILRKRYVQAIHALLACPARPSVSVTTGVEANRARLQAFLEAKSGS